MDPEYENNVRTGKPDYRAGWEKFFDTKPEKKEFPTEVVDRWATSPNLPKELNGEAHFLAERWSSLLQAHHFKSISGTLATYKRSDLKQWHWRDIKLEPLEGTDGVYGDMGDIATSSSRWFEGSGSGINGGIRMPRGYGENMEKYNQWWNHQVKANFDMLEKWSQRGIFERIFNNPDQFKLWLSDNNKTLRNYTVEQFKSEFYNPAVNVFRKEYGWVKLEEHSKKLFNIYYPERDSDKIGQPSWIYLITPEANKNVRLERHENLLYLYKGKDRTDNTPRIDIYKYNRQQIHKNAIYVLSNFSDQSSSLGKNLLTANFELNRYHMFIPWNYKNTIERTLIKGQGPKSYNMFIARDAESQLRDEIYYPSVAKNCVKLWKTKFEAETDLYALCVKYCVYPDRDVDFGFYAKLLLDQMGLTELGEIINDEAVSWNWDDVANGSYYEKQINFKRYKRALKKFIACFALTEAEKLSFFDAFSFCLIKESILNIRNLTEGELMRVFLINDIFGINVDYVCKEELMRILFQRVLGNRRTVQVQGQNPVVIPGTITKILENMIEVGLDLPFGIILMKRMIAEGDITPCCKKKAMVQYYSRMLVSASQEAGTGVLHVIIHQRFGEHMHDFRTVQKLRWTFIEKVVSGGKNKIYSNTTSTDIDDDDEEENPVKYELHKGGLYPVPVHIKYVLKSRERMINMMGYDNDSKWNRHVGKMRMEDKNPYFKPILTENNPFGFKHEIDVLRDEHRYITQKNQLHFKDDDFWAGYTRYAWNDGNTVLNELGPCENHPDWWNNKQVAIHVRNVE